MLRALQDISEFTEVTGLTVGDVIRTRPIKSTDNSKECMYLITGFNFARNLIDLGVSTVHLKGLFEGYEFLGSSGKWERFAKDDDGSVFEDDCNYKAKVIMGTRSYWVHVHVYKSVSINGVRHLVISYHDFESGIQTVRTLPVYCDNGKDEFIELELDVLLWAKDKVVSGKEPKKIKIR